jgi:hypothetical protein
MGIVIEPLVVFKAQKVCRVLEPVIATDPLCVQVNPPPETLAGLLAACVDTARYIISFVFVVVNEIV